MTTTVHAAPTPTQQPAGAGGAAAPPTNDHCAVATEELAPEKLEGTVQVRAPSPALAPFVEWVGYIEPRDPDWRELLLPTGMMALVVNLGRDEARWYDSDGLATAHTRRGAFLLGASAGPVVLEGADWRTIAVVRFRPGGGYPFFDAPASAIDEPAVELEALWGRNGAVLREQLLEASAADATLRTVETALLARAVRPLVPDPTVVAAAAMLGRGAAVATVADRLGWTDRTLLRRFSTHVGVTPKGFARRRRLHRLLGSLPPDPRQVDWGWAAAECGYFDQAHLINEFRALTGLTPTAYRPDSFCHNHRLPTG